MTHSFTYVRLCKQKKRKRQTDWMTSFRQTDCYDNFFDGKMKPAEAASCPSNEWLIHTRTHSRFCLFLKTPSSGCAQCGKKKGGKRGMAWWENEEWLRHISQDKRNLWKPKPGFAFGMMPTDRNTWCHTPTLTHTILCLVAVAPPSHDLPPERITHCCPVPLMPIYGHSQDTGWYYPLQTDGDGQS